MSVDSGGGHIITWRVSDNNKVQFNIKLNPDYVIDLYLNR